jgi:hypothetical protein
MVIASDLIDSGHLLVRTPTDESVDVDILKELLDGLRKLA